MTVNEKISHFSSFSSGFRKILLPLDKELPTQAENDRVNSLEITCKKELDIFTHWISFTGPLQTNGSFTNGFFTNCFTSFLHLQTGRLKGPAKFTGVPRTRNHLDRFPGKALRVHLP